MAVKKVYFFKVSLFDENNSVRDYKEIKELIGEIVEVFSHDQEKYKTLDLTEDVYEHVIFDIYEYKQNRLFGRLSKQRPSNSMVRRNYKNLKKEDIQLNDREFGIEQYTYGCLDYDLGVFSIVSASGAPTEKAFEKVFQKYASNLRVELVPIPNPNSIEKLYASDTSEISSLEITIPLPSLENMQQLFGWENDDLLKILGERNLVAKVQIKSPQRKSYITHSGKETKGLIDKILERKEAYFGAKLKAKTSRTNMREYDFFEQYFSYSIDIVNYRIENYERMYYSVDELMEIYRNNIFQAFLENKKIIKEVIGR